MRYSNHDNPLSARAIIIINRTRALHYHLVYTSAKGGGVLRFWLFHQYCCFMYRVKNTHTTAVVVPHNKWAYTSSNEFPTHTQECPPKCDNYTQRLEYGVVQCFFANESGIDVPRPARASPTGNNDNDGSIQLPLYWKSYGYQLVPLHEIGLWLCCCCV
jgi:hypothetical protein